MAETSKPWSGWRRLWVVLSVLGGAPILWSAYQPWEDGDYLDRVPFYEVRWSAENHLRYEMNCARDQGTWTYRPAYPAAKVTKRVEKHWRPTFLPADPTIAPKELFNKEVEQQLMEVSLRCRGALPQPWWWMALLPALAMAVIGLTTRWIYRGFRPAENRPSDQRTTK